MDFPMDLEGAIRPGLDMLANETIIALKKRSRYKQNLEIYKPGLVVGQPERTLLDYELNRMEKLHAELGRYMYASQEPFTDVSGTALIIKRSPPPSPVRPFAARLAPVIIDHYIKWVERGCAPGSDSNSWGESVTSDVNALLCIQERINIGKYVAEFKFQKEPDKFKETNGDAAALRALIVKKDREAEVLQKARKLAEHYAFDPNQAEDWFRWKIAQTVEVEIAYLRERIAGQ